MFFELHSEKRIGYKELTDADLGRSKSSHQTHIGLFDDVLTFMPNRASVKIQDALFIYKNEILTLSVSFDRIQNPDGTFRSPKIRMGGRNVAGVVACIRDIVKEQNPTGTWYLFWFGLQSEQPVFILFEKNSEMYSSLINIGIDLCEKIKGRLTCENPHFTAILSYFEKEINAHGVEIAESLELSVQTNTTIPTTIRFGNTSKSIAIRKFDFDKAREKFKIIGRQGEELVDKFFAEQFQKGVIVSYTWVNKDEESGLPYDFYVEKADGEIFYLDVKSTDYKFEQKMIFSSQEINFAAEKGNKYYIYRVFSDENGNRYLKICPNAKSFFLSVNKTTKKYELNLQGLAKIEAIKLAVLPTLKSFKFCKTITLNY